LPIQSSFVKTFFGEIGGSFFLDNHIIPKRRASRKAGHNGTLGRMHRQTMRTKPGSNLAPAVHDQIGQEKQVGHASRQTPAGGIHDQSKHTSMQNTWAGRTQAGRTHEHTGHPKVGTKSIKIIKKKLSTNSLFLGDKKSCQGHFRSMYRQRSSGFL
jgi:hypothetical protein